MKVNNIKIYFWLIDILLEAGEKGLMLTQIQRRYCEDIGEKEYQRRTFINHRKDILEIFGIDIECRISDRRYYIANDEPFKDISRFRAWMYDAISASIISEKMMAMSNRIVLPHIKGSDLIPSLVKAITQNRRIDLYFELRHIEGFRPYGLCQKHERWILAGMYDGELIDIELVKVQNIIITEETFYPDKEWDAKKHFAPRKKQKSQRRNL